MIIFTCICVVLLASVLGLFQATQDLKRKHEAEKANLMLDQSVIRLENELHKAHNRALKAEIEGHVVVINMLLKEVSA